MRKHISTYSSKLILVVVALGIYSGGLGAQTITFDNLVGTNGNLFNSYSEGGFDFTVFSGGQMCAGTAVGNPAPSVLAGIACGVPITQLTVRRSNLGMFRFRSMDVSTSVPGFLTYLGVVALQPMPILYSANPQIPLSNTFTTMYNMFPQTDIDLLRFAVSGTATRQYSFGIDNITLTTVPEPSTLVLVGAALLALCSIGMRARHSGSVHS